jgi:Zn-dependent protease
MSRLPGDAGPNREHTARLMRFEHGHLTVGTWQQVPVRLHWTLPFGLFVFSGFQFALIPWLGMAVVILVHEIGHAMLARRFDAEVNAITLHGFGGACEYEADDLSRHTAATIAWGGVLAQLGLCVAALFVVVLLGPPQSLSVEQFFGAVTRANLVNAAFNLLPIPPLDGSRAWWLLGPHLRGLRARLRYGRDRLGAREALRRLQKLEQRAGEAPLDRGVDAQLDRILREAREKEEG